MQSLLPYACMGFTSSIKTLALQSMRMYAHRASGPIVGAQQSKQTGGAVCHAALHEGLPSWPVSVIAQHTPGAALAQALGLRAMHATRSVRIPEVLHFGDGTTRCEASARALATGSTSAPISAEMGCRCSATRGVSGMAAARSRQPRRESALEVKAGLR